MDDLSNFLKDNQWDVIHKEVRPSRQARYVPVDDLALLPPAQRMIAAYPAGIYAHQHEAIRLFLEGRDVAITTSTASGKTLVFNACAADLLARGNGVVVALYPLKSLGSEQAERWSKAMRDSGLDINVGYIDGSVVNMAERLKILERSRVVVMTPDIMHAWLLRKTSERVITNFIKRMELVVIDEAHAYTSVFGSNSAFVFRRLAHARSLFGGKIRYIAASATMDDPLLHLNRLTGSDFDEVGDTWDSAPKAEVTTLLVRPTRNDGLTALAGMISHAAEKTSHKSIAFVDSRQLAEHAAVIAGRETESDGDERPIELDDSNDDPVGSLQLPRNSVLPYRSGYDEDDRRKIHTALVRGRLKAVVSTSALELGIDIPGLTLCILYGIPPSGSSFRQRYGRVGRSGPGLVIIVDDGSPRSTAIFSDPTQLWSLPLTRSSLYLHNRQAQYIHAMCLARLGGEDEVISRAAGATPGDFGRTGLFPYDFVEICQQEKNGNVGSDLRQMKEQAGDSPNLAFPLRDIGQQFSIKMRRGPDEISLGTLSYAQVMREAFPGAVHYHRARAYRVTKVSLNKRTINVREEKRYFTKPITLPIQIYPNVDPSEVYADVIHGQLRLTECHLNIRETVVGLKERRGNNELNYSYPLDPSLGLYFDQQYFNRTIFTSGVVLTHPIFDTAGADLPVVAEVLLEAFLMEIPFDRQDIGLGFGVIKQEGNGFMTNQRFVCLYDKQHSLRLSGEMINPETVGKVFARGLAMYESGTHAVESTRQVLTSLASCSSEPQVAHFAGEGTALDERYVLVLMPDQIGVDVSRDNMDYKVSQVFFHPAMGVSYRGVHVADANRAAGRQMNGAAETIITIDKLKPIPGQSLCGWYDLDNGVVLEKRPGEF